MINIAIDGPAGVGKSSIGLALAKEFDLTYLNSGLFYRCVAKLLEDSKLLERVSTLSLQELEILWDSQEILINSQGVFQKKNLISSLLTTSEISLLTSQIATIPQIRDFVNRKIQEVVQNKKGFIIDGRDVATKILPNADLKIFLDASSKTRALRRVLQLQNQGIKLTLEEEIERISIRDTQDRERKIDPLVRGEDSLLIETDDLDFEAVMEILRGLVNKTLEKY